MAKNKTIANTMLKEIFDLYDLKSPSVGIRSEYTSRGTIPNDVTNDVTNKVIKAIHDEIGDDFLIQSKGRLKELSENLYKYCESNDIKVERINWSLNGKEAILDNISELLNKSIMIAAVKVDSCKTTVATKVYPCRKFDSKLIYGVSQCFVGREAFVTEVVNDISKGKSCYLYGIGGVGKTEILRAVIKRLLKKECNETEFNYDGEQYQLKDIYWLNYPNQDKETFFANIIGLVKTDSKYISLKEEYSNCLQKLQDKRGRVLVVIDNIESIGDDLNCFCDALIESGVRLLMAGRPLPSRSIEKIKSKKVEELSIENCKGIFSFYRKFTIEEDKDVETIINLVDKHTITVELLAKLIRKQEQKIGDFLQILIDRGFNFKFSNEDEELVSSNHDLMRAKERKIIEQLKILFNAINLSEDERQLLIKISVIPNLPFNFSKARKWFSLSNRSGLENLSSNGWLNQWTDDKLRNKYWYCLHSIVAMAIRAQYKDKLYEICQPFMRELTNEMVSFSNSNLQQIKLLTQFGWSVADVFQNDFCTITDYDFILQLANMYDKIGLQAKAVHLGELALRMVEIE